MTEKKIPPLRFSGPGRMPGTTQIEYAEHAGETLRRLTAYFIRERKLLGIMLGVAVFGTLCGTFAPSLQSAAIDIIAGEREGNLRAAAVLMLGAYLLYSICQLMQGIFSARLSQRLVRRMRQELFDKIMSLPLKYLDTHAGGDLMSRMTNDIENISATVSQSLPSLCSGVLAIVGTMAVMLWYCWQLALLSVGTVGITVFVSRFLSRKVRRSSRQRQKLLGQLNSQVEEMISGYRTVTAYNRQKCAAADFAQLSDDMTRVGIQTDAVSGIMGPLSNCIGNVGFVIIAAVGGYFSLCGMISVGVISAFIVYARQLSRPINELTQIYGQFQTAIAGAERVFCVLDEQDEPKAGQMMSGSDGTEVLFRHVDFSYQPEHPVLWDFNLKVSPGEKVALVGATGSGKTTVVNLLMRFYEPDGGEITVNGQNIRELSTDSLRHHIAIVLQDTVLFSGTVRHNLSYANEGVSKERLQETMAASHCDEFIRLLPHGIDTELHAAGGSLSQGQRQLLAIARAFAADPQILILDEATSNVDTRTERSIQDAMRRLMEQRTSIIIAHRLSTIRDADMIVVMDQGRVAEAGTHEELLAARGKYYELYMAQYVGFST